MARALPPLTSLRAFEAAARLRSFTKAATELHVTPAAISHQIRGLEKHLGVRLFRRKGRQIELTEQGEIAAGHFREAFERLGRGVSALRAREREGVLILNTTPAFATRWLVPRLGRLARKFPGIELRVRTGRSVVDFDSEDVDAAIRFGRGALDRVAADRLFSEYITPVAVPSLLREHALRRPGDLAHVPLIQDDSMRRAGRPPSWDEWCRAAGEATFDTSHGVHFDDGHLVLQAAAAGQGVALGRLAYAAEEIAAGVLQMPFRQVIELDLDYYLLIPEARRGEPTIAAFRRWLLAEARGFQRVLDRLLEQTGSRRKRRTHSTGVTT
jgi:LysR family glycine cleavage system transcriptional activator